MVRQMTYLAKCIGRAALLLTIAFGAGCKGDKTTDEGSPAHPKSAAGLAPIRITAIPDENPTELIRKFSPMVKHLEDALGRKVIYTPVTDYGAAVQAMIAGRIDFAWLGGFTHVQARTRAKVVPLVMRGIDRNFRSVVIVSSKSGIARPAALKGHTFAFGSKSSTSGHLMPRHFLMTTFNIDAAKDFKGEPVFSGAHDATAKIVESGKVSAGALNKEVWERLVRKGNVDPERVRVLWTTPPYVDYVWTARLAVDAELRKKFTQAFLGLDPKIPAHQKVLALQGAAKFVRASPSDFDAIEAVARSTKLLK